MTLRARSSLSIKIRLDDINLGVYMSDLFFHRNFEMIFKNVQTMLLSILEQIDEAYQVLKQGKALRLVQTGEDIREGTKRSIADPVFWKSLFSKKSSLVEEDGIQRKSSKFNIFGNLLSRSTKMPKTAAKEPYCALYPFRASDKQDISLKPGDKLYVFDARDDNWWFVSFLSYIP